MGDIIGGVVLGFSLLIVALATLFIVLHLVKQKKLAAQCLPPFLEALKSNGYSYDCKGYHGTIFADDTPVSFTAGSRGAINAILSNRVVTTFYYTRYFGKAGILVFLPYAASEYNKNELEKIIAILREV